MRRTLANEQMMRIPRTAATTFVTRPSLRESENCLRSVPNTFVLGGVATEHAQVAGRERSDKGHQLACHRSSIQSSSTVKEISPKLAKVTQVTQLLTKACGGREFAETLWRSSVTGTARCGPSAKFATDLLTAASAWTSSVITWGISCCVAINMNPMSFGCDGHLA